MIHTSSIPAFPFARSAALLATLGVVTGLVAAVVCVAVGNVDHALAAAATAVVCALAAEAGLVPVWWRSTASLDGAAMGFVLGMLLRAALTFVGILILTAIADLPIELVAIWAGAWYLMLLAVEVMLVNQYLNQRRPPAGNAPVMEPTL